MKNYNRQRYAAAPRLQALENRLVPTGTVSLISQSYPSQSAAGGVWNTPPSVSDDGRFIAFASDAKNLVAGQIDTNNSSDVFLYDRLSKATTLVSHATGTAAATANQRSAYSM